MSETWNDRPIESMNREELVEALTHAAGMLRMALADDSDELLDLDPEPEPTTTPSLPLWLH